MIVGCVGCGTKFVVPDEKVPESGIKVRCSKCQQTFYIKKERPKRGGPSSVVMIDPELIAEVQRTKEATEAPPVAAPEAPAAPSEYAQPTAAVRRSDLPERPMENTRPIAMVPTRSSKGRAATALPEKPSEEMLELSEVYLPTDWTKRITAAFLILLGVVALLGVLVIVRNDFKVPALRDAFTVLLSGPKKKNNGPLSAPSGPTFEVSRTGTDHLTSDNGVRIAAVQAEVKNTSNTPHGLYYVRATLSGPGGETLTSERPCGTHLELTRLAGITSEAELEKLFVEEGENGANKAVKPYESVQCSVVFFGAPEWATNPARVDLAVTKVDGNPAGF